MKNRPSLPHRVYKYRAIDTTTLDMIVMDRLYYADPSSFNDPLDTRPSLKIDVDENHLEKILRVFVERRTAAEMKVAATAFRVRGPKTTTRIKRISRKAADKLLDEVDFFAEDMHFDFKNPRGLLLRNHIQRELLRQYDKGIVSLAERCDCPLMWSHYGEQHRGLCIGYSVPREVAGELHRVRYGGARRVGASDVAAMLDSDEAARGEVDEAVLLRKASGWSYEKEWRLIGHRGVQDSPLELEEIIFGIRCRRSVKYAVMKALAGREPGVRFGEMREVRDSFKIEKHDVCLDDEDFLYLPKRARSELERFELLTDDIPI